MTDQEILRQVVQLRRAIEAEAVNEFAFATLVRESTKYRAEYIARREVRAEKLRRASAYLVSAGEEIE